MLQDGIIDRFGGHRRAMGIQSREHDVMHLVGESISRAGNLHRSITEINTVDDLWSESISIMQYYNYE